MIYLYAFLIGGLICMAGQLLMDLTKLTPARILVLFVCLGVVLGGLGWYPKLVELAGAGATVPLTGFGNALAQGVKEAVQKDGLLGVFTGGFTACAGGVTVAVLSALVVAWVARPKDKSFVTTSYYKRKIANICGKCTINVRKLLLNVQDYCAIMIKNR